MKETGLAGEKIKREKWVRDNTKKIKVYKKLILNTKFKIVYKLNYYRS